MYKDVQLEKIAFNRKELEKSIVDKFDNVKIVKFYSIFNLNIVYEYKGETFIAHLQHRGASIYELKNIRKEGGPNKYYSKDKFHKNLIKSIINYIRDFKDNIEIKYNVEIHSYEMNILFDYITLTYTDYKNKVFFSFKTIQGLNIVKKIIIYENGQLSQEAYDNFSDEEIDKMIGYSKKLVKRFYFLTSIINQIKSKLLNNELKLIGSVNLSLNEPKNTINEISHNEYLSKEINELKQTINNAKKLDIIKADNIYNEYYINQLNIDIEQYDDLDEDMKNLTKQNIKKFNKLLNNKIEEKEIEKYINSRSDIIVLSEKLNSEL